MVGRTAHAAGRAVAGAVGFAAGAAAALAGKGRATKVDAAVEEVYWRDHHANQPYCDATYSFEDYLPAYRVGWEGRARFAHRKFEDIERDLQAEYHWNRGQSRLQWEKARHAARAAWDRIDRG